MEWKWTKGEPYERSRRPPKKSEREIIAENDEFRIKQEEGAYTSSLNYDESTWDILNQSIYGNGFRQSNKREDLDSKIADRALVQQRGFNPFLTENTYANDINVSNMYLQPVNTSQEREKGCTS